jgi:hypothetical protein
MIRKVRCPKCRSESRACDEFDRSGLAPKSNEELDLLVAMLLKGSWELTCEIRWDFFDLHFGSSSATRGVTLSSPTGAFPGGQDLSKTGVVGMPARSEGFPMVPDRRNKSLQNCYPICYPGA